MRSLSSPQRHREETVVVAAIAREMAAFLWAVGREVASVRATLFFPPLAEPGVVEHERWGTPVLSYVAGFAPDARPLDRGKPRDEDTEGGSQPADKSLINRRLFGSQCLLLPTAVSPQPALNRDFSLDREHKKLARAGRGVKHGDRAASTQLREPAPK